MSKIVTIILNKEDTPGGGTHTFITEKNLINYQEWGIDAVVTEGETQKKVYIPYGSIQYIEEVIG